MTSRCTIMERWTSLSCRGDPVAEAIRLATRAEAEAVFVAADVPSTS